MTIDQIVAEVVQSPQILNAYIGADVTALNPLAGGNVSYVFQATLADGRTRVAKFSDSYAWLKSEKIFLETWSNVGIPTPQIYACRRMQQEPEVALLVMEHVAGQNLFVLMEAGKVPAVTVLYDLGTLLAQMHQPTAQGYGPPIITDSTDKIAGPYENVQALLAHGEWAEAIAANLANTTLKPREIELVQQAASMLDMQRGNESSCYAHTDFRAGNIIYNPDVPQPYTIIDPNPELTHPYLCLAYSLLLTEIHGRDDPQHMRQGYETITAIDDATLHAAIFLKALFLLPRWGQPGEPYAKMLHTVYSREKQFIQKYL
jgi:aminoglycoside phosphotransferase (APT) family kinase protein